MNPEGRIGKNQRRHVAGKLNRYPEQHIRPLYLLQMT